MTRGADDFTETTINELSEDDLEQLSHVWPAAFLTVSKLLIDIDQGEVVEGTSLLDLNLYDLIREREC